MKMEHRSWKMLLLTGHCSLIMTSKDITWWHWETCTV